MAEKTTEAHTFECDAPKCDVTHVCVGEQEPKGIRLTAEMAYEKPVTAYACKPTHIRPAVEARLNDTVVADARSDEERDADAAERLSEAEEAIEEMEAETAEPLEDGEDLSGTTVSLAAVR